MRWWVVWSVGSCHEDDHDNCILGFATEREAREEFERQSARRGEFRNGWVYLIQGVRERMEAWE